MNIVFETARLSACPPRTEDALRVTEFMQDKDLPWMLARAPWPYALKDAEGWIAATEQSRMARTEYAFVLHHDDHGLIGSTGMMHVQDDIWEIGYWIGKPYWGAGFVTEAARGLMQWAEAEHGITRLVSGHIADNIASGRVLIKLGFEPIGEISMYVKGRDCEVPAMRYVRGAPAETALHWGGHG